MYAGIPPVECSAAMQLCPQGTSTWRDDPKHPTKACKFSSTLVGKAYSTAGRALHAMAIPGVRDVSSSRYGSRTTPSPGGGGESLVFLFFLFRHWPGGRQYPNCQKKKKKSRFLYLWVPSWRRDTSLLLSPSFPVASSQPEAALRE